MTSSPSGGAPVCPPYCPALYVSPDISQAVYIGDVAVAADANLEKFPIDDVDADRVGRTSASPPRKQPGPPTSLGV